MLTSSCTLGTAAPTACRCFPGTYAGVQHTHVHRSVRYVWLSFTHRRSFLLHAFIWLHLFSGNAPTCSFTVLCPMAPLVHAGTGRIHMLTLPPPPPPMHLSVHAGTGRMLASPSLHTQPGSHLSGPPSSTICTSASWPGAHTAGGGGGWRRQSTAANCYLGSFSEGPSLSYLMAPCM